LELHSRGIRLRPAVSRQKLHLNTHRLRFSLAVDSSRWINVIKYVIHTSSSITPLMDQFNHILNIPTPFVGEIAAQMKISIQQPYNSKFGGWWKKFVCRQSKVLPPLLGRCSLRLVGKQLT
jgi:hypothetical protein